MHLYIHIYRERHRDTERHRETQRDTYRHIDTPRHPSRDISRPRYTERDGDTQSGATIYIEIHRYIEIYRERHIAIPRDT